MSASSEVPIAIVGMGCRFPGGVRNSADLWRLAAQRRCTVGPVPQDRWDAAGLGEAWDPDEAVKASRGSFLEDDVWAWDPDVLSIAPLEQDMIDPQFRLLMEVAWEAVEHAGIPLHRLRGTRAGVYMGTYTTDNLLREARPATDAANGPYLFGNMPGGAAGRVAFALDLRGPVMAINTYCSSGLVAVDTACSALTLGECDTALAGAVLLMLSPEIHHHESPLLLSRSGACHAFDLRADGYLRGEGAGVLVLKRLADALRDDDRVLAVIRGSAVNNDGQSTRLTAPSMLVQQQLFHQAVRLAGVDAGSVGLVEAHGPGTPVGDPIEYQSINAVYGKGRGRCALGSLKTNIGHTEPVAGIAGTIKAVESLRRGLIPPNSNFSGWNPTIDRSDPSRLFVPTEVTPWPVPGEPRLAAVCSYGVSGTNAHIILQAAPERRPVRPKAKAAMMRLFALSASSPQSLAGSAGRLADWIESDGAHAELADVVHTLAMRRWHADQRLCVLARDRGELAARARAFAGEQESDGLITGVRTLPPGHAGPVFVFTGQGSQHPGMCQGFLASEPVFQAAIAEIELLIRAESDFSLREMIIHPDRMVGVERVQPTLFGVQVGMARMWQSWGVQPAAVLGQSLGEVAAAVVAGGLSLADGVRVICRRSALLTRVRGGAMASVMADAATMLERIQAAGADQVSLGVLTAPDITVLSGDAAQVAALIDSCNAAGLSARRVDVDVASHSAQMDPIVADLREVLTGLSPRAPAIPFFSTVTQDPAGRQPLDGEYWVRNQRETVQFHHAVSKAMQAGHRLFIECAPHSVVLQAISRTAQRDGVRDAVAVGTLLRGKCDIESFLSNVALVHCAGFDGIAWGEHYGQGELVDVPTIAWNRTRHGGGLPYRLVAPGLVGAEQHPLLGGHVSDPDRPGRHLWQTPISPARLPWLSDHRVADTPVLPGTGYLDMMLAAASAVWGTDRVAVSQVQILAPLVLDPEPTVTTRLIVDGAVAAVEVVSGAGDTMTVHARGDVRALDAAEPGTDSFQVEADRSSWGELVPEDLYRRFRQRHHIFHGPAFTGVDRVQIHPEHDTAVSLLRIPEAARISAAKMLLHPALADELIHTAIAVWLEHHTVAPGPLVVAGFGGVRVLGPAAHTRQAHVVLEHADDQACSGTGRLLAADGTVLAEIHGLRVTNITPPAQRFASRLLLLQWAAEPAPPRRHSPDDSQAWVIMGHTLTGWPAELASALKQLGHDCTLLAASHASSARLPSPGDGVVLVVEDDPSHPSPAELARQNTAWAVEVIQQLARQARPPRLWLVTSSQAGTAPLSSAGWPGLLRVAAYEHPSLAVSSICCRPGTPLAAVVSELLDSSQPVTEIDLGAGAGERRVAHVISATHRDLQVKPDPQPVIRPGAAYVVTGGLGGLGLVTVNWLARSRAARVVAVGRTAPGPEVQEHLDAVRRQGTEVIVITGDIADPAIASQAVTAANAGETRLRGVLHGAGVVEDATFHTLTTGLLQRVWRGKAEGAWALHQATLGQDLELFVVYSSVASLTGSPGQAAYAAANAFLDSLVSFRLERGLPATSIQWGAWSQVGRGQHLARHGFATITPSEGIDALERILDAGWAQIGYSPLDLSKWTAPYPAARESVLLSKMLTATDIGEDPTSSIRQELLAADTTAARREILQTFIIGAVREMLHGTTRHIGPHTSMVMLGVDSLGAVQLQQRLQRTLKVDIEPGVIWVKPTAAALSEWLLIRLTGEEPPHPG